LLQRAQGFPDDPPAGMELDLQFPLAREPFARRNFPPKYRRFDLQSDIFAGPSDLCRTKYGILIHDGYLYNGPTFILCLTTKLCTKNSHFLYNYL
jgi:hypothetical protein